MELQSLKQLILDEDKPIEERLKAIKLLKESNSPDREVFLQSLCANRNIQIRYFTKKVLSDKEPAVKKQAKQGINSNVDTYTSKINEKKDTTSISNPAPSIPEADSTSDKHKFYIIAGGIACGIFGVVLFIVVLTLSMSSNSKSIENSHIPDNMTVADKDFENYRKELEKKSASFRQSILIDFNNNNYIQVYNKSLKLFTMLNNKVNTKDYKLVVNALDALPWKFFSTNINKIRSLKNKALADIFTFVYQIKSLIIKNRLSTNTVLDILNTNVRPMVFLSSKTIKRIEENIPQLNSTRDRNVMKILCMAYRQKFLTAQNNVSVLRLSGATKLKVANILNRIEANNMHLPDAEFSLLKDVEFIKRLEKSLEEDNLSHFENILEMKVGIDKVSASIREIYYAFRSDLEKGRKILNFGIERTFRPSQKNSLRFLLAKHFLAFNRTERGISILYSLYYKDLNPDAKELYSKTIEKTLEKESHK